MENDAVADILDEIADLLELKDANEFRIRSYRSAARTVRDLTDRLEDLVAQDEDLSSLPNIGQSTAQKIHEMLDRGTCTRLEELREEVPRGLVELMHVPYVGPRTAMELQRKLGVENLDDLQKACEKHHVRKLSGMGQKTEERILEGIATVRGTAERILYKVAADHAKSLARYLDGIPQIKGWEFAGSFRRRKETVGDLDVLLDARDREKATEVLTTYEAVADVLSRGSERVSVRLRSGLQIDFRFFEPSAFGAALVYFTGSKAHNITLRRRAQDHDWKLNEYGLFKGKRRLAGKTEQSVYQRLSLPWIPPELREDRGEIEAADQNALPHLIKPKHIRGDLHVHTNATDGQNTIEEMARAARDRGYEYLAITDHSKAVRVAKGLDDTRLRKHVEAIRSVNDAIRGLRLLAGVEVDILKSGKLDLNEKTLSELDWVVAAVHSHFDLSEKKMTERLLTAIRSGVIHCIAHPTGRMIGKRDPIRFDAQKVFGACAEHNVRLEIDSQPNRLDLPDTHCQDALKAGVSFTIITDAHSTAALELMLLGVNVARRGWLEKKDVLNTRTIAQLRKELDLD